MASSDETVKGCGICCGVLILIYIIMAVAGWINSNSQSIAKNAPNILWIIAFLILLIGILYEAWKAVTH